MSKKLFDDDSDSDIGIKINENYAKNYSKWRKKEELHKLKAKYGEEILSEESSSSSDDEDGEELTEEIEKEFFRTLSALKNNDPVIYDENIKFFENVNVDKTKKKKEKHISVLDYNRQLTLEKDGNLSDEEEIIPPGRSWKKDKESIGKEFHVDDSDDEDGMMKFQQETAEEEADYKEWLPGQEEKLDDKKVKSELKSSKDYWNNLTIDEGDRFLCDYILNKKFQAKDTTTYDSDNDLSDDEQTLEKQEEFEHKYNFRFEEPDQEFIKRYPRTIQNSLRRTDDKRKLKRAEIKERKQKEKEEKMRDIKKLQELKRLEIEEKIEKLKEVTGNKELGFNEEDFDGDFDPEEHDRKMQNLFNEEFYQRPEGEQKPEFPELDEYLEVENWDRWDGREEYQNEETEDNAPHCEDEDFNMDADYDPKANLQNELVEQSKNKKKRKRKSLFAKAVSQPKPVFDPNEKTFEEYFDEYYKLDCEDIIGDVPCRFKYRKVPANSFGLTIEEILMAKERELNKWCSLKKAVQYRPDHVEKYDQIAFMKKGSNIELKKKILPSLFEDEEGQNEEENGGESSVSKKKKKGDYKKETSKDKTIRKRKDYKENINEGETTNEREVEKESSVSKKKKFLSEEKATTIENQQTQENNRKKETNTDETVNEQELEKESSLPKKKKKKSHNEEKVTTIENQNLQEKERNKYETDNGQEVEKESSVSKKKKKKKKSRSEEKSTTENQQLQKSNEISKTDRSNEQTSKKRKTSDNVGNLEKKFKKNRTKNYKKNENISISDARLSAYGINPKKFRNKLKYGNNNIIV